MANDQQIAEALGTFLKKHGYDVLTIEHPQAGILMNTFKGGRLLGTNIVKNRNIETQGHAELRVDVQRFAGTITP